MASLQRSEARSDIVQRVAMFVDAILVFLIVELAGGSGLVFLPAYGLLVALYAHEAGFRAGLMLAAWCAVLLTFHDLLGTLLIGPLELLLALSSLFLLAGAVGWMSEKQRSRDKATEAMTPELRDIAGAMNQAERINMLGRLTANIAHEFNNPISAILTRLDCMLEDARDEGRDATATADLQVLHRQARKLADISGKLLRFARPAPPAADGVDINEAVEKAVDWIEHRLPEKDLLLNLNLSRNLPRIRGQSADLEEAMVNLLTNAIDSCSRNGQIYVISALSGGRERTVQIFVADTGEGIAQEHLREIFDPFFTTKEVGAGTGLGLFITHEIIRRHRGTIEVQSERGKGTTFVINLPVPFPYSGAAAGEVRSPQPPA